MRRRGRVGTKPPGRRFMSAKRGSEVRARKSRNDDQRQESAAMTEVMKAWEALSDEERLTWDIAGKPQRMKGIHYFKQVNLRRLRRRIHYFKQVNLRRLRRGDELARLPVR